MKIKKVLGFMLMLTAFSVIAALSVSAETYGDFIYDIYYNPQYEECAFVSGYTGTSSSVVIPSEMDGYKVEGISYSAFSGNEKIESVTMPDTIVEIYSSAFDGCINLKTVRFSSLLKNIESNAFYSCKSLTSVSFGDKLERISYGAFYDCTSLIDVSIPDTVKSIGDYAFGYTPFLENQGTGVRYAGKWVVDYNGSDSTVTLRSGTVGIADDAFCYSGISGVNLPPTLKYIGSYAFYDTDLADITIPSGVTFIGERAFCDTPFYNSITDEEKYIGKWLVGVEGTSDALDIKSGTVGIAEKAVSNQNIKYITIPETVRYINEYAFNNACVEAVYVPDSVTEIQNYALSYSPDIYTDNPLLKEDSFYGQDCISVKQMISGAVKASEMTSTSITLKSFIENMPPFAMLQVYQYDDATSSYTYKSDLSSTGETCKITGLSPDTIYKFRVRACYKVSGDDVYSDYVYFDVHTPNSTTNINAIKSKISSGYVADINKTYVDFGGSCEFSTDRIFGRCASVPSAIQFFDHKGNINFAVNSYSSVGDPVKIIKLDSNNRKAGELNIPRKYSLFGNVICDDDGYYYIVWGNDAGNEIVFTETAIAVSKYTNTGKHVKTTTYTREEVNTAYPFNAGNCDVVISNGVLVCNFARTMCNGHYAGHQSNGIIAVNISDMSKNDNYYTYNSHSFDQRVIADKYGDIWFASHGDSYNRAFTTQNGKGEYDLFHFYVDGADTDNMWIVNVTNAQMGGIADSSAGVIFVGASVKGMTEDTYYNQTKNLFITSADQSVSIVGGTTRTGICKGETVTDANIRWLTDYTTSTVNNPQVVSTDKDEIVILWEKLDANYCFVESYYTVLSSNGMTIHPVTSLGKIRLNGDEMPIYKNGRVYWITADYDNCYVVELNVGKLVENTPAAPTPDNFKMALNSTSSIRLSWNVVNDADGYIIEQYNGTKWERTKKIEGYNNYKYSVTGLQPGKAYKFRIKTYKFVDGKAYYSKPTAALDVGTKPSDISNLKIGGRASDALRLNWSKNTTAGGYIIEQYKGGKWVRIAKINKNSTTTYRVEGLSASSLYRFRIKAYNTIGSSSYYSGYTSITAYTNPRAVANLRIGGRTDTALRLNWDKNKADGYIVEQYKGGKWLRIAKITSNSTTTYRVADLSASIQYKFRVKAYKMDGKTACYSGYKTISTYTNPSSASNLRIGGKSVTALRLNWNRNITADGYIVEMYNGGKWVRLEKITDNSVISYRKTGLAKNTEYKFRVKTFRVKDGVAYYGAASYVNGKTNS